MANSFLKPEVIAATSLGLLQREVVLPRLVWNDAVSDFAGAKNDTVSIRVPARLEAREYGWRNNRSSDIVLDELGPELSSTALDAAYRERAHLVALLAALNPSVIVPARDVEEPGWTIVYVYLHGDREQQLSWHIHPRDAGLFQHVQRVDLGDERATWDGHTTDAKYERIRAATAALGRR